MHNDTRDVMHGDKEPITVSFTADASPPHLLHDDHDLDLQGLEARDGSVALRRGRGHVIDCLRGEGLRNGRYVQQGGQSGVLSQAWI